MTDHLNNENNLLLLCARTLLSNEQREELINVLEQGIEWESLILLASHHKLLPLLHKHLSEVCPDQVPVRIKETLQTFYQYNSLHNLNKFRALTQIVKLFEEQNIKTLSIKGPLFTLQYLGDISLRSFCDIDILVRQKDLKKSVKLLQSAGYHFLPVNIPEQYFMKFARLHLHARMEDDQGVVVETHWRLSSHYGARRLDYENLTSLIEKAEHHGVSFLTLRPEMLLVYLSLHAQKHCWQRYDFLLCIAEVLNRAPELDWFLIKNLTETLKMDKVVFFSLYLAKNILNASISSDVLEENMHFNSFTMLVKEHKRNWQLINRIAATTPEGKLKETIYPLKLQFINKSEDVIRRYCGKYFIPREEDWVRFPIPYAFYCIYYFTRPSNKFLKFLRKLFLSQY